MSENKFVLKRHVTIKKLLGPAVLLANRLKFNIDVEKFSDQDGQYLIMMNHTTGGDQFFVSMAFNKPIYFIASEDLFTNGFISKALSYVQGPIPIKKNATDVRAVKQSMRVAKEGGSICLAPEGNRTYSGATGYMNPAITKFARSRKLPVAVCLIEGGYGKMPRWADKVRSGKMTARVSKVVQPENYLKLSDEELLKLIHDNLDIDESTSNEEFFCKNNAEYVERFLYICPECGLSTFESSGDHIRCRKCGNESIYTSKKTLEPLKGEMPYRNLKEWYDAQENFINSTDTIKEYGKDKPVYKDSTKLINVIPYVKKIKLAENAEVRLYSDRITATYEGTELVLDFDNVTAVSCVNRNKLNIYHNDKVYQFKGDKRFNPLKYMHFYYRYQHIIKGENDDKFLGL
ncbi:MAG: 1-acyl-sn-glycerol-3-phosphate acyltransferase [Clostridia bacterium]|nr:1-acyl-sn-glycerol-3-phosphate acyltransferase [Clostridia bacterium]